jgi:hypothetical protein
VDGGMGTKHALQKYRLSGLKACFYASMLDAHNSGLGSNGLTNNLRACFKPTTAATQATARGTGAAHLTRGVPSTIPVHSWSGFHQSSTLSTSSMEASQGRDPAAPPARQPHAMPCQPGSKLGATRCPGQLCPYVGPATAHQLYTPKRPTAPATPAITLATMPAATAAAPRLAYSRPSLPLTPGQGSLSLAGPRCPGTGG